jgi:hypothetical protein
VEKNLHENVDNIREKRILSVEETAQYLRKSISWVYKNADKLGGRKLGGSLFFPSKEDLYERIFIERKGVEVRLHPPREQAHGSLVQNQTGSKTSRSKTKGGGEKPKTETGDPNRHGLFRPN